MNRGEIGVLNVGAGDTRLSFDPAKPAERERAAKVLEDMLKRGYAILVQVGEKDGKPLYTRAEAFDPETCEYIIVGLPEDMITMPKVVEEPAAEAAPKKRGGRPPKTRLPAATTRAVAVARSAGG